MQFTYTSAHAVRGISPADDGLTETLLDSPDQGVRVLLPRDLDATLLSVTRAHAIFNMMLLGEIKDPLPDKFRETLRQHMTEVEEYRRNQIEGNVAVVVVEVTGDIDVALNNRIKDVDHFAIAIDLFKKDDLHTVVRPKIYAALVGLRLGTETPCLFEEIDSGTYLTDAAGKIIYSGIGEVFGVELYSEGPLTADHIERAKTFATWTLESADLQRPIHLHAQALSKQEDKVRGFLDAWTALEVLIRKMFPHYRDKLSEELHGVSDAAGLRRYLKRVANVMKDKHSLLNEFEVISVYLDPEKGEHDLDCLQKIKKHRDGILHGEATQEDELPTREVQALFDKYLRNHLLHQDAHRGSVGSFEDAQ